MYLGFSLTADSPTPLPTQACQIYPLFKPPGTRDKRERELLQLVQERPEGGSRKTNMWESTQVGVEGNATFYRFLSQQSAHHHFLSGRQIQRGSSEQQFKTAFPVAKWIRAACSHGTSEPSQLSQITGLSVAFIIMLSLKISRMVAER